jgi:hypothetical protein
LDAGERPKELHEGWRGDEGLKDAKGDCGELAGLCADL